MRKELAKTYDPQGIEDRIYKNWEDKKYFHAEVDYSKKPFTIVIPPPNITGQLHMGHALDNTMQDILIRFKRMQGYNALWQPGTDHAAIATEVKVIDALKEQGIDKNDLGREGFLEKCWDWRKEYGTRIVNQLKKLGSSCDWDRERFTMDEGCSNAVQEVFIKMHEKGWIYKGSRIINWCPVCKTSISDAEVQYEDQAGHFWHIKYPLIEEDGSISKTRFLEFATTRPETMLGDTAVAVHPEDDRYKDVIGRKVWLPFVDRQIPIVADEYVDREFGTGVVKITPAHDPNDFEVGKRHHLPEINILNDDATINANGGKFVGMDRYECRKQIVKELDEMGLLVEIEDYSHNVGTHDRCGTTVEPMIKPQWFVKMDELIKPAVEGIKNGDIKLIPKRMEKTYFNWTDNIRDWCISRQLWWGHRIPAYTCDKCGEITVARQKPETCPCCGHDHLTQDPDTLDTWFSSALWPFSTLGRKMSKSLGNGIDPLEIIHEYGADALRMTLITGNAPGNDMRFYNERVIANRNFGNKVWNASRFIMMNMPEGEEAGPDMPGALNAEDKWILSRFNTVVKEVTENMERFELGIAVQKVYDFIWDEFCDWYIEMVKPRLYQSDDQASKDAALWTLQTVLIGSLKLLHPYMPFITEEIFTTIQSREETIMLSAWPVYREDFAFPHEEKGISMVKEAVRAVRNIRAERNVAPSRKAKIYVVSDSDEVLDTFREDEVFFKTLAFASDLELQKDKAGVPDGSISAVLPAETLYIPLADLLDVQAEIARLQKEEKRLQGELKRSAGMLSNEKFLAKAPAAKIEAEKEKQKQYEVQMEGVRKELEQLRSM